MSRSLPTEDRPSLEAVASQEAGGGAGKEEGEGLAPALRGLVRALSSPEPPPGGLDPSALGRPPGFAEGPFSEPGGDRATTVARLGALSQELHLAGRRLAAVEDRVESFETAQRQALARARKQAEEDSSARRSHERDVLIDLIDRLQRCVAAARRAASGDARGTSEDGSRPGWWAGLWSWLGLGPSVRTGPRGAQAAATSLIEGTEMVLKRLEDELTQRGIDEISALGRPFDPATMKCVERRAVSGVTAYEVIRVERPGYRAGEQVLRPAEVVVAVAPGDDDHDHHDDDDDDDDDGTKPTSEEDDG